MGKWIQSYTPSGLSIKLARAAILAEVTASVTAAGDKTRALSPAIIGRGSAAFGKKLSIATIAAPSDPTVALLKASYSGGPLDGADGVQLHIGLWNKFETALALYRFNRHWTRPAWLSQPAQMPDRTQYLLVRRNAIEGKYLAILPLTDGGMRGELRSAGGKATLASTSCDSNYTPGDFLMAAVAVGDDPYELTERIFSAGLKATGTGRLRTEKPTPDFVGHLGWCSWNAFYQNVTESGIIDALKTFSAGGLPVGFYILDDG